LAYGEYAMGKSSVFERHGRVKEGRDVQDVPRSGQPKTKGQMQCEQSEINSRRIDYGRESVQRKRLNWV
jgi:hypothetical protein